MSYYAWTDKDFQVTKKERKKEREKDPGDLEWPLFQVLLLAFIFNLRNIDWLQLLSLLGK